jgi:hypothetical protein
MSEDEWLASEDPVAMLAWLTGPKGYGMAASTGRASSLVSDRKLRLFACACCRQVWDLLTDERSRRAVEVAEESEEGRATSLVVDFARGDATRVYDGVRNNDAAFAAAIMAERLLHSCSADRLALSVITSSSNDMPARAGLRPSNQAALLREIVGNPYRPTAARDIGGPAHPPLWRTSLVTSLAQSAYEERSKPCPYCKDADFASGDGGMPMMGNKEPYATRARTYWRSKCACKGRRRVPSEDGSLNSNNLAILADALEEMGCTNEDVLRHLRGWTLCPHCMLPCPETAEYGGGVYWCSGCGGTEGGNQDAFYVRSPTQHVRGCWALDLILGK